MNTHAIPVFKAASLVFHDAYSMLMKLLITITIYESFRNLIGMLQNRISFILFLYFISYEQH